MTTLWICKPSHRWLETGGDGLAVIGADSLIEAENTLRRHEGHAHARLFLQDDDEFGDEPSQHQCWIVHAQFSVDDDARGFVTWSYWVGPWR